MSPSIERRFRKGAVSPLTWDPVSGGKPAWICFDDVLDADLGEASLTDVDAALILARRITHTGVPLVVISLGDQGIAAAWGDRSFRVTLPAVRSVNSVGAT